MRVDAFDDLTVELQYEAQDAVSRRMLGPKIEGEVAQGGFGHNGLASAAGSTLAADAGARSIGFQFHRADGIDAARTGRASGTSMLLSQSWKAANTSLNKVLRNGDKRRSRPRGLALLEAHVGASVYHDAG